MSTLLKFFPLMPKKGEVGKLVGAIIFYAIVPVLVAAIIGFILGLTMILAPLAIVVGSVLGVYGTAGLVFAILQFAGVDLCKK